MAKEKLPGLQTKQPNIVQGQRGQQEPFVSNANPVTYKYTSGKAGNSQSKMVADCKTEQTRMGMHHSPES